MPRNTLRVVAFFVALSSVVALVFVLAQSAAAPYRNGPRTDTLLSQSTEAPTQELEKPIPASTATLTSEPYPPPVPTIQATPTNDPTRVAMTHEVWASEFVQVLIDRDSVSGFADGPFTVLRSVDVFPGDMPFDVTPGVVGEFIVPDVAVVLQGTFRNQEGGQSHPYMLALGDRRHASAYRMKLADTAAELLNRLP